MRPGARTPEELEALLEDAFVTGDAEALCGMFAEGAVVLAGDGPYEARGVEEIGRLATTLVEGERTYVAEPHRVVQARDTAVIVGSRAINVVRRGGDGTWRYVIALLPLDGVPNEEEQ